MAAETMRAWAVQRCAPIDDEPLALVERAVPSPGRGEVRLRVTVCGVCRTDLHLAEGDVPPRRPSVVPGHEVVGVVDAVGPDVRDRGVGDRVGVAWLRATCGTCRFCASGRENLCLAPSFTGWDADGGFAEYTVAPERATYRLPDGFDDETVAPLLCAGIIGYRALRRAQLPPRGRLGVYGFGASAHLTAQIALAEGAVVHVRTRSPAAQRHALSLGAASAGDPTEPPIEPLDAAILFAPAGELVPTALAALDRGGTLAIAGIHLTDVPRLVYEEHLFYEREIRSVTANTWRDGQELFEVAARVPLEVATVAYPFERGAEALRDLAHGAVTGAAVLRIG